MASTCDTDGNAFDFDTFPATGAVASIPAGYSPTNDWDDGSSLPAVDFATNPLTASFTDLDLAPARDSPATTEFDAGYWFD